MYLTKPNIIVWLITPPNNIKAFLSAVAVQWAPEKVIIIACHDIRSERRQTGYTNNCDGIDEIHILDNVKNGGEFVRKFIEDHINDIHIFGGLRKEPAPFMYYMRKKYGKKTKIIAFTEKPAFNSGSFTVRILKQNASKMIYPYIFRKAMKTVDALFVVSKAGIKVIEDFGWKKNNIYNFMYCDNEIPVQYSKLAVFNRPIRFLYVGRFDFKRRGLDIVMQAFNQLEGNDWELYLVGGYGENKDDVISWADSKKNVCYGGTWPANKVMERMREFDIYICPVKEDSWNGQINMALSAGLGVITTNQAGSDELVTASGAGTVICAGDSVALKNNIEKIVKDRGTIVEWKQKARLYAKKISAESVANYFCEVIASIYLDKPDIPQCPWL